MNLKNIFIIFLIIHCFFIKVYAAQSAKQALNANLPATARILNIIVEDSPYAYGKNDFLGNLSVTSVKVINSNLNILRLTPIRVQIEKNCSETVTVSAIFQELKNDTSGYNFSSSDLFVFPGAHNINTPPGILSTDDFIPYFYTRPSVIPGVYRGKLLFTLGIL